MNTQGAQDRAAVRQLGMDLVNLSLDRVDHGIALQALLLAFTSIAAANPCCKEVAASAAEAAAMRLRSPDPSVALAGPHIH